MSAARVLVVDGNIAQIRCQLLATTGYDTATAYARVLRGLVPDIECDLIYAADPDASPPPGTSLESYDGVAITGSALNVPLGGPAVVRQVEFARAVFEAGVPMFGSCWGLQVAVAAAGGVVQANPRGREFGFARRIMRSPAGREHPLLNGKPDVFEAPAVHRDDIAVLPPGAVVLAQNEMSIQATTFECRRGTFWGVQYHPEYDYRDIATVARRYEAALLAEGLFRDVAALALFVDDLEALQQDPHEKALLWKHGLGPAMSDFDLRLAELKNWLTQQVLPRRRRPR